MAPRDERPEHRCDVLRRPLHMERDHDLAAVGAVALAPYVAGRLQPVDHPFGFPATGGPLEVRACVVFRLEDGKVAEIWPVIDSSSLPRAA